jgi:hypothetical protein
MDDQRTDREGGKSVTIEDGILASLQRRVSTDDLPEDERAQFIAQMQAGDELWYFLTPDETWTTLVPRCGLEGYALIRCGKVIELAITSMS